MLRLQLIASNFGVCLRDSCGFVSRGSLRTGFFLALLVVVAMPTRAAELGKRSLEAGAGVGQLDVSNGTTDLKGWFARWNQPSVKILLIDTDVRLGYSDTRNDGGPNDLKWQNADLSLFFSLKIPGLRPFANIGGSYETFEVKTPLMVNPPPQTDGYEWGYSGGVGLEMTFIPLVTLTPAARYVKVGNFESARYSVDLSLWIKSFGFGASFIQTEVESSPVRVQQGWIYMGFRF